MIRTLSKLTTAISLMGMAGALALMIGASACGPDSHSNSAPPAPPPPKPAPNACLPSNAMQVAVDKATKTVTAYIPNSDWEGSNSTGIQVVPVEGSSGATCQQIPTTDDINTCSYDNKTKQVVCTSNDVNVYVISGTTITKTLNSGGQSNAVSFNSSGGVCATCNVAMGNGYAAVGIDMGLDKSNNPITGYELLDMTTLTFGTPATASAEISEAPSYDIKRQLILSPNYDESSGSTGGYQIAKVDTATGAFSYYNYSDSTTDLSTFAPDSAAEDCTTGVAMSTLEFTNQLFLANLNKATYSTSGSTPTWDAPSQIQTLHGFGTFTAGTTGIAVAPGAHVALLEDEFGTTGFGAIELPSKAGSGAPSATDWVTAVMPNDPSGAGWEMPLDPHGLTAYMSPNSGKPIGLIFNLSRTYMAQVDINALLAATRAGSTGSAAHEVSSSVNLLTTGIVTFIKLCPPAPPA